MAECGIGQKHGGTKPSSPEDDEKDINKILAALPNKGILEFTYGGMRKLPVVGQSLEAPLFQMLLKELKNGRPLSAQRKQLMARIGKSAWFFTACIPTGEYRLNLSRAKECDVALILVALKNQEQEVAEEEAKRTEGRVGGRRNKAMERIWRNATYNNRQFVYDVTWQLLTEGISHLSEGTI